MHKLFRQQVVSVWLAMLGVLFSALAPGLSHAMTAAGPTGEAVQVCTMEGMKTILIDAQQPDQPGSGTFDHLYEHCPYCSLHGGVALPPPSLGLLFALLPLGDAHPPLFYQAAYPLFQWSTANPRAPPSQG